MNREEFQYLDTVRNIVDCGIPSNDRTGVGTKYLIGQTFKYDLSENKIPIWTTRKIPWKNQVWELIWFLRGQTDVKWLQDRGVNIWNSWVKEDGTIGPGYGKQWRRWETFNTSHSVYSSISNQQFHPKKTIDQFSLLIEGIKQNPDSRRHLVTLWNPADVNDCVLPPCFAPGTLILTQDGYKTVEEIKIEDKIYDADLNLQNINKIYQTPFNGNGVSVKTRYKNQNLISTENHPFLVKNFGYKQAKDLKLGDYLGIPRNKNSNVPEFLYERKYYKNTVIKKWQPNENDFFMMGYFLGDGWAMKNNRISFSINNRDVGFLLPKLRESIKISKKPTKKNLSCHIYETKSLKWYEVLKQFGKGAKNKKIPNWILDAPIELIKSFIEGYKAADGCNRNLEERYTTISKNIAFGLQLLYAKIGKILSVSFRKRKPTCVIEGRTVNQNHLFELSSSSFFKKNYAIVDDNYIWIEVVGIEKITINDNVYNFDVNNTHTYTANNIANHNCHGDIIQFIVEDKKYLHCFQYQRSADFILGYTPWQYALLTNMVGRLTNLEPKSLTVTVGNCHVYNNQLEGINTLLTRSPKPFPALTMSPDIKTVEDIENSILDDYKLVGYEPDSFIKFPIAV